MFEIQRISPCPWYAALWHAGWLSNRVSKGLRSRVGEELFNIMQNEGLSTLQDIHPRRERGLLPSREAAELSPEADADNPLTKAS